MLHTILTKLAALGWLALFTLGHHAAAQQLWGGTVHGERTDQVTARWPSARSAFSPALQRKGYSELLATNDRIVDRAFTVFFYFKGGGLDSVILRGEQLPSNDEAAATYWVLVHVLVQRYGKAALRPSATQIAAGEAFWMMWHNRDTDILLVPQHRGEPITISYSMSDRGTDRAAARRAEEYLRDRDAAKDAGKF